MKADLHAIAGPDAEGTILDAPPLIPAGSYRVRVLDWSTCRMFGRQPKVLIRCQVCDLGNHFGVQLFRYYNARRVGRLGRNGTFSAGWSSDLVREHARLVGWPVRCDRLTLSRYKKLVLLAEVVTVEKTRSQEALPTCTQYSVIRRFLRVEAGVVT